MYKAGNLGRMPVPGGHLAFLYGGGERSCTAVREWANTSFSERSCSFILA